MRNTFFLTVGILTAILTPYSFGTPDDICPIPDNPALLISTAWPLLDTNNSGLLELSEVLLLYPDLDLWMFNLIDSNNDGALSPRELLTILPYLPDDLLSYVDQNGNGILEYAEVSNYVTPEQFATIDKNNDGIIDCYDFMTNPEEGESDPCNPDVEPPVITFINGENIIVNCGDDFISPEAVAIDNCDGDISASITVSGSVDATLPGTYTIICTASDAAGNSVTATCTVTVLECPPEEGEPNAPCPLPVIHVEELIDAAWPLVDTNGDNAVDYNEVIAIYPEMPTDWFNTADSNNDGLVEKQELLSLLTSFYFSFLLPSDLVTYVDDNSDRLIQYAEVDDYLTLDQFQLIDHNSNDVWDCEDWAWLLNLTPPAEGEVDPCNPDRIPPEIILPGDPVIVVDCSTPFVLPGVIAVDNCDGDLTDAIVIDSTIDLTVPGTYTITLTVSDSAGNTTAATCTVIVGCQPAEGEPIVPCPLPVIHVEDLIDAVWPLVDANGDNTVDYNEVIAIYPQMPTDWFNTADRNNDGIVEKQELLSLLSSFYFSFLLPSDLVTYVDANGDRLIQYAEVDDYLTLDQFQLIDHNSNDVWDCEDWAWLLNLTPPVEGEPDPCNPDLVPPEIILPGDPIIVVDCNTPFVLPGAIAMDNCDGDLTDAIVIDSTIDVTVPGTYTITLTVSDSAGNTTAATCTVIVECQPAEGEPTVPCPLPVIHVEELIDAVWPLVDANADNVIDYDEVIAIYPQLPSSWFSMADSNGDGIVEKREILSLLTSVYFRYILPSDLVTYVDANGDRLIQYDEVNDNLTLEQFMLIDYNNNDVWDCEDWAWLLSLSQPPIEGELDPCNPDLVPPEIILPSDPLIIIDCNAPFLLPGVIAMDNCDGDITSAIVIVSTVDLTVSGAYTITLAVSDSASNTTTATCIVIVDCTEGEPDLPCPLPVVHADELIRSVWILVDANEDDVIDYEEIIAVYPQMTTEWFDIVDNNGDGIIEQEEVFHLYGAFYFSSGMPGDLVPFVDSNGDRIIQFEELQGYLTPEEFQIIDHNDNGVWDCEDWEWLLSLLPPAEGEPGPCNPDVDPPVITFINGQEIVVECGDEFTYPEVIAIDNCEGDITAAIVITDNIDTTVPGAYTLTYTVSDTAGNTATATYNVIILECPPEEGEPIDPCPLPPIHAEELIDPAWPLIDANGDDVIDYAEIVALYPDMQEDWFNMADSNGDDVLTKQEVLRLVTSPYFSMFLPSDLVTLVDANNDRLIEYAEVDGYLTLGQFLLIDYNSNDVWDCEDWEWLLTGTPPVEGEQDPCNPDLEPPVITFANGPDIIVDCGDVFTYPEVTAMDNCVGNLTAAIEIYGDVDPSVPGIYDLTYAVSDASGNEASATCSVTILDCPPEEGEPVVPCPLPPINAEELLTVVWPLIDANGDDAVSYGEIIALYPQMPLEWFNMADRNGDGLLEIPELLSFTTTIIIGPMMYIPDDLVIVIDANGDRLIQFEELDGYVAPEQFQFIDHNENGVWDCEDWEWLHTLAPPPVEGEPELPCPLPIISPEELINILWSLVNTNGDDIVTYGEILALYPQMPLEWFNLADLNGDGVLKLPELLSFTTILNGNKMPIPDDVVVFVDDNGDRLIQIDELDGYVTPEQFLFIDHNNNGVWDCEDWGWLLTLLPPPVEGEPDPCNPDLEPPVITFISDPAIIVNCGDDVVYPEVIALDNCDGDLTPLIEGPDDIDPTVPGTYTILYVVSDAAGNFAEAIATIVVVECPPEEGEPILPCPLPPIHAEELVNALWPLVDANGDGVIDYDEIIALYPQMPAEWFAMADQNGDGVLEIDELIGDVIILGDTTLIIPPDLVTWIDRDGDRLIQYDEVAAYLTLDQFHQIDHNDNGVWDCEDWGWLLSLLPPVEGEQDPCNPDLEPPFITFITDPMVIVSCGDAIVYPEVIAQDNCDGDLAPVLEGPDDIDPAVPGTYTILYVVSDAAGNIAEAIANIVVEGCPPEEGEPILPCPLPPIYAQELVHLLWPWVDRNDDDVLVFEEIVLWYPQLTDTLFAIVDQNQDGMIELHEVLVALGNDSDSELVRLLDADGNRLLEYPEIALYATPDQFHVMDRNHNDVIDCEDWEWLLSLTPPPPPPPPIEGEPEPCSLPPISGDELIHVFSRYFDRNGDEVLSFREINSKYPQIEQEQFIAADTNGDRRLDINEVVVALALPEIADHILLLDENGDRLLQYSEVTDLLTRKQFRKLDYNKNKVLDCEDWEWLVTLPPPPPAEPDPHWLPVLEDTDGDFLTDREEVLLGMPADVADRNNNRIPDGVDLARRLCRKLKSLEWIHVDGDPHLEASLSTDAFEEQLPTDRIYVIRFDYMVDCVYDCPICEDYVTLGHLLVVNPVIHASWKDGMVIPLHAWHFMEHGSFSYFDGMCGPGYEKARIDPVALVATLFPDRIPTDGEPEDEGETDPIVEGEGDTPNPSGIGDVQDNQDIVDVLSQNENEGEDGKTQDSDPSDTEEPLVENTEDNDDGTENDDATSEEGEAEDDSAGCNRSGKALEALRHFLLDYFLLGLASVTLLGIHQGMNRP